MPISFFLNSRLKRVNGKVEIINRIKLLAYLECREIGDITIIMMSDDELLQINNEYLQHNYYTDIITFDYTFDTTISGDLYISVDRVKENARLYHNTFNNELKRVIIHGILHLCGYKDKSKKDKLIMRNKEDFYLSVNPL